MLESRFIAMMEEPSVGQNVNGGNDLEPHVWYTLPY